jgi:WD40-like Beta Propeller Repeat
MLALASGIYLLLWHDQGTVNVSQDWTRYAWAAAMAVSVVISTRSTFHLERAARQEYAYRLPLRMQGFLNSGPQSAGTGIRYAAFIMSGYHLVTQDPTGVWSDPPADAPYDDLSFASRPGHLWVERASSPQSQIVDLQQPSQAVIDDAREPMLSVGDQSLAFLRDDHGRGRLMVRRALQSSAATEVTLTPPWLNVYEASFVSERLYAYSAVANGRFPQVYLTDATHMNAPITGTESRYPALSPDGKWMAYSHLQHGMWNLWLRDQRTGAARRVADVPCNQIQPAWESDSRTLLYDTDCGRSVWFTAVARRRVVP